VPLGWIRALDLLMEQRKSTPYLTLMRAAEIAQSVGVTTKIRDMLHFFHEFGVLCYLIRQRMFVSSSFWIRHGS
jgi:hypothetical protein